MANGVGKKSVLAPDAVAMLDLREKRAVGWYSAMSHIAVPPYL
jgi:hypothetical protein